MLSGFCFQSPQTLIRPAKSFVLQGLAEFFMPVRVLDRE
jgi:hypothetical protein